MDSSFMAKEKGGGSCTSHLIFLFFFSSLFSRFRVNFACGQHEGGDIPFHFNPRFDGKDKTVLNTFQSGRWGNEEIHEMPFRKHEHFEIIFIVNDVGYQVGTPGRGSLGDCWCLFLPHLTRIHPLSGMNHKCMEYSLHLFQVGFKGC
uniref:Galectin n=1 Tax=Pseudonaja textilis TaxID=8673 RepID=A0A670Z5B9_PSETE